MGSIVWGEDVAAVYDVTSVAMWDAEVLGPAVDRLAEFAAEGPALEFAIGTGRVALPLVERGVEVHGIELSRPMVDRLRLKRDGGALPVTIGDMTSATAGGRFALVYLVWNGITNVTTQQDQVAVFRNAARHLVPGGRFVVEVIVPQVRRVPADESARVFINQPDHVGVETFDDRVQQIAWSHHWMSVDGRLVHHAAPYRYVWPSELDLMAEIAGLELEHRWADWNRGTFTADSDNQVSVFKRL
jgi:SAM-dependent methyltransferase